VYQVWLKLLQAFHSYTVCVYTQTHIHLFIYREIIHIYIYIYDLFCVRGLYRHMWIFGTNKWMDVIKKVLSYHFLTATSLTHHTCSVNPAYFATAAFGEALRKRGTARTQSSLTVHRRGGSYVASPLGGISRLWTTALLCRCRCSG
jgi:hypothetical protein